MKKIYLIIFLLLPFVLHAQTPDRSAPPKLAPVKNLQLPAIQRFTLSNGLNVLLMEKHGVPLVQVNALVETGSFDDPSGKEGLLSFTMDLMDEGAGQYSSLQLAEEIEFLGASITTSNGNFSASVNCSTPVSKLDPVLKLMSDIILKPTFAEEEIERVRKLRLNGLLQTYDEANAIAARAFDKFLFDAKTPYGKFAGETSIRSYTKDDVMTMHRKVFVTGNTTIIAVGDVTKESLLPLLEKYFASFPKGTFARQERVVPQQIKGRNLVIIDKPGAAQSVIRIGRIGVPLNTPDFSEIQVMNTILGGSFASRLNTNLREVHGYSYGAGSSFSFWPMAGPFVASSSVQTDVTGPALGEFFNEFKKMRSTMPEEDFTRGKNYNALGYAGDFETNSDLAGALAQLVIYKLPDHYFNTYIEKVLAVSKKQVEAVAKKYIVPDNMLIVVVGDKAKIEEGIKKLNLGTPQILSIEDVLGKKPQL